MFWDPSDQAGRQLVVEVIQDHVLTFHPGVNADLTEWESAGIEPPMGELYQFLRALPRVLLTHMVRKLRLRTHEASISPVLELLSTAGGRPKRLSRIG